jgi:hypothetical protein
VRADEVELGGQGLGEDGSVVNPFSAVLHVLWKRF